MLGRDKRLGGGCASLGWTIGVALAPFASVSTNTFYTVFGTGWFVLEIIYNMYQFITLKWEDHDLTHGCL